MYAVTTEIGQRMILADNESIIVLLMDEQYQDRQYERRKKPYELVVGCYFRFPRGHSVNEHPTLHRVETIYRCNESKTPELSCKL